MPPREDFILFLDLETTGTDVPADEIIEVGLSLISTEEGYPEVDSFSRVIAPNGAAFNRLMQKKVVREMHMANGLLDELFLIGDATSQGPYPTEHEHYTKVGKHILPMVERDIISWLKGHLGNDDTHVPFGGSGVLHFDRKFIRHFMPHFDRRLTHWAYDVGVMRRMFIKAGAPYAELEGSKTHRALDDARVHADEFRWYQKFIRG